MRNLITDKDYQKFSEYLLYISEKVCKFGDIIDEKMKEIYVENIKRNFQTEELKKEDVDNLINLFTYDLKEKKRAGINSIKALNIVSEMKKSNFYKLCILLTSDNVEDKSKETILNLLNKHKDYPYQNIVKDAEVSGLFFKGETMEKNASFLKTLERKDKYIDNILKVIDNSLINCSERTKNTLKYLSPRLMFGIESNNEEITNKINKLLVCMEMFDLTLNSNKLNLDKEKLENIRTNYKLVFTSFLENTNIVSNNKNTDDFICKIEELARPLIKEATLQRNLANKEINKQNSLTVSLEQN